MHKEQSSQQLAQFHRDTHVARHLELAHHHAGHRIELASQQLDQIVLGDADRAVSVLIDPRGRAVGENDNAIVAAIKLQRPIKAF